MMEESLCDLWLVKGRIFDTKSMICKKKKKKEINKCHKNSTLLLSEGHCSENNFLSHRLGEDTCKLHI